MLEAQLTDATLVFDGNVLEHNWGDAQNGFAILFTPRNQGGTAPWSGVQDITFTNNIAPHNQFGVGGSNTFGNPPQALATYFPGAVFTKNILIGGRAEQYPAGNYFPATVDAVGFADIADTDYRLKADSQYRKSGTDGADLGADLNAPPNTRRHAVGEH